MRFLLILLLLLLPVSAHALGDDLPPVYDIILLSGEDYSLTLDMTYNTKPVILTGNTYTAQCKDSSNAVFANMSAYASPSTTGRIVVKLSNSQTAATAGKVGTWKLIQQTVGGIISYIVSGKCTGRTL